MSDKPARWLGPAHLAIIAALPIAIGVLGYEWVHISSTLAGKGPPALASAPASMQQQARADVEGQSPEGSNSSQDAYTAQNRSREPTR